MHFIILSLFKEQNELILMIVTIFSWFAGDTVISLKFVVIFLQNEISFSRWI